MNADALDHLYGVLCRALERVGEERAELFLAALSLDLLARHADRADGLAAIERAEKACLR